MATGAALMWPAVLGMTFQALPPGRRALAGGLVIGVAGIGNAIGPLVGGALTEGASWRLVFAVNIPLVLVAIWLARRFVHQPFERDPDARLDPGGVALLAVGLVALLLALDLAADGDLVRPISLALLGLFVVMAVAFVAVERRVGDRALVPRDVMVDRRFRATCMAGIFMSIPLFSVMLFLPQYFSKVQGYGAFGAGLALLPLMVSFAMTSFVPPPTPSMSTPGCWRASVPPPSASACSCSRSSTAATRTSARWAGWSCSESASACSTRWPPRPPSRRSTSPAPASAAPCSTCSRSREGRSGWR